MPKSKKHYCVQDITDGAHSTTSPNRDTDVISFPVPKMSGLLAFNQQIRQHLRKMTNAEPDFETLKSFEDIFRSSAKEDNQVLIKAILDLRADYNSLLESHQKLRRDYTLSNKQIAYTSNSPVGEEDVLICEVMKNRESSSKGQATVQDNQAMILSSYMVVANLLMKIFQIGFFDQKQIILQILASLTERSIYTSMYMSPELGEAEIENTNLPTLHSVMTNMYPGSARMKFQDGSKALGHISVAYFFSIYAASRNDIKVLMRTLSKREQQEKNTGKTDTCTVKEVYKEHILYMCKYMTYERATEVMEIGSKVYKMAYVLDPEGVMGIFILHWLKVDYAFMKSLSVKSLEAFVQFCTTNKDVFSSLDLASLSAITDFEQLKIRMAHFVGRTLVPYISKTLRRVLHERTCTEILPASLKRHLYSVRGVYDQDGVQQIGFHFSGKAIGVATKYLVDRRFESLRKEEDFHGTIQMDHNKVLMKSINSNWSTRNFSEVSTPLYLSYFIWWLEMQDTWIKDEENEMYVKDFIFHFDPPRRLFQDSENEEADLWIIKIFNDMRQIQGFDAKSALLALAACSLTITTIDTLFDVRNSVKNSHSHLYKDFTFWAIIGALSKLREPKDLIALADNVVCDKVTFSGSQEKFTELLQTLAKTKKCIFARDDVISLYEVCREY